MKKSLTLLCLLLTTIIYAQIPTNGLVGWYPFTGNAGDSSGNGNHSTVFGATLTTDRFGNANAAYNFDGADDYMMANPAAGYLSDTLTVSFWVSYDADFGVQDLIDFGDGGSVRWGCQAGYNDLRLSVGRGCSGTGNVLNYQTSNGWHNIMYILKGTNQYIYYDGDSVGTVTNFLPSTSSCATSNLWFGVDVFSAPEYYDGKLDDIAIWNRVLTPQEITAVAEGGGGPVDPCTVYDTVTIYDTTHITVYDTVTVFNAVTDTLVIDVNLTGINPPNNTNAITVYPNPAKDHLVINNGTLSSMTGYSLKITNALGQIVFNQPINQQQFYIDVSAWGGNGTYILYVIDAQQAVKSIKQIVLQ